MAWIILSTISGLITLAIAYSKDRRLLPAFLSGFFFGFLAWIYYALSKEGKAKCPRCRSRVRSDATRCKYCGSSFSKPEEDESESFRLKT